MILNITSLTPCLLKGFYNKVCNLGVNQGWLCSGVSAESPIRDCSGLLYEKGSVYYGCHRCSY